MSLSVAVIGAGLAGLCCARRLQAGGAEVTVFEKSRGPGGRCATRRSAFGPFHHGAPSFAARGPAFAAELAQWQVAGWVRPAGQPGLWVGWPTMNALASQLAGGLRVSTGQTVTALAREARGPAGTGPGWRVITAEEVPTDVHASAETPALPAHFDAVVVALPAEQALVLTGASVSLQAALRAARSEPCWTLMLAWPHGAAPAMPPTLPDDGPLAAVVDCSALGPVPDPAAPAVRWAVHARPGWSREQLELPAAEAAARLWQALAAACAASPAVPLPPPAHSAAHRWRYAQVGAPAAAPFGWDAPLHLGCCGDAWQGAAVASSAPGADGVERAWLGAQGLAAALLGVSGAPRPGP